MRFKDTLATRLREFYNPLKSRNAPDPQSYPEPHRPDGYVSKVYEDDFPNPGNDVSPDTQPHFNSEPISYHTQTPPQQWLHPPPHDSVAEDLPATDATYDAEADMAIVDELFAQLAQKNIGERHAIEEITQAIDDLRTQQEMVPQDFADAPELQHQPFDDMPDDPFISDLEMRIRDDFF